jgi:Raf kinase inhibitor-like YbhB/YbcL family protein
MTMATWREMSTEPVLMYTPHAAPMQLVFYDGDAFADDYRGDAFVTFRGSWNRAEPSGYEVVRVAFENGKPGSFEPFLTGFLQEQEGGGFGYLGRPVGLAVTPNGALLVADDSNGVIYRVVASGATASSSGEPTLGTPTPVEQTAGGDDGALAIERLDAESDQPLEVISSAFENDQPIPARFAAEHQNYSPPLDWSEGPEGTRSYAILMEDPDASQPKPFVHWIAYNIPADTTRLNEGVPGAPRLTEPAGALQGMNSRGSTGLFGMKPPAGDPPHRYNVQVFALDRELELQPGADREAVLGAMEGHVLGAGKLTGQFQNDGSR